MPCDFRKSCSRKGALHISRIAVLVETPKFG
nr:MAG TPA: hypothetical protein [Caudoviricetes sp.]